jgi:hypothetical protein
MEFEKAFTSRICAGPPEQTMDVRTGSRMFALSGHVPRGSGREYLAKISKMTMFQIEFIQRDTETKRETKDAQNTFPKHIFYPKDERERVFMKEIHENILC